MDAVQYALRRKDTGEYFWTPKKTTYKKLPEGDPKLRNWVANLDKAKLFSWRGVRVLASQENSECKSWDDYIKGRINYFDVEIVKCKLVIEEVITVERKEKK